MKVAQRRLDSRIGPKYRDIVLMCLSDKFGEEMGWAEDDIAESEVQEKRKVQLKLDEKRGMVDENNGTRFRMEVKRMSRIGPMCPLDPLKWLIFSFTNESARRIAVISLMY